MLPYSLAMIRATVVLPVPGLPVKTTCRLAPTSGSPASRRSMFNRCTASSFRTADLTAASPMSASSSARIASVVSLVAGALVVGSGAVPAVSVAVVSVVDAVAVGAEPVAPDPAGGVDRWRCRGEARGEVEHPGLRRFGRVDQGQLGLGLGGHGSVSRTTSRAVRGSS